MAHDLDVEALFTILAFKIITAIDKISTVAYAKQCPFSGRRMPYHQGTTSSHKAPLLGTNDISEYLLINRKSFVSGLIPQPPNLRGNTTSSTTRAPKEHTPACMYSRGAISLVYQDIDT